MDNRKQGQKGKLPALLDIDARVRRLIDDRESTDRPPWRRILFAGSRIVYGVAQDLRQGQLTLRAMSLVYTTLLSLVPLLAISFSVLKGFGVHDQIEPLLLNLLAPLGDKAMEVAQQIVLFVDNTKVGVLGFLGFVLLFYTVVSLMQKIESAVNEVWRVSEERNFIQRFRDYLSVIVVGPVLIFSSIGIMASLMSAPVVAQISAIQPFGWILQLIGYLVPVAMVVGAFTFIYVFIPNTEVRPGSALVGGIVSGILWHALGWVFATFVATSAQYTAIYSGFATPILFMIWLYLGWLILLTGASIAFYHQHPDRVFGDGPPAELGNRARERIALLMLREIGGHFYAGGMALSAEEVAAALNMPSKVLAPILATLARGRLLGLTGDEPPRYFPARPLEITPVKEVLDLVRAGGDAKLEAQKGAPMDPGVDDLMARVDRAIGRSLEGLTLKDLLAADEPVGQDKVARKQ